jgi:hypothetical protein
MNPTLLGIVGLRAAALALALAGQTRASNSLYTLADAAEAGIDIDLHMRAVADKLKTRSANDDDWADLAARIEADSDRLQGS